MNDAIEIVLATYNAERYLQGQLDSLLAQTYREWCLLVRDDVSSDRSVAILNDYLRQHPSRIKMLEEASTTLGACQNFAKLLLHTKSRYIMLCDQDDVWMPQKIELSLAKMKDLEERYGKDQPLLVHTDLKVVNDGLTVISDSLWKYQRSDAEAGSALNRLLLQNVATGCSILINRPLRDLAVPVPSEAVMHDWWLVLVAAAFGHIGCLAQPTALYRQHAGNDTGAKRWSYLKLVKCLWDADERKRQFALNSSAKAMIHRQAEAFLHRYEAALSARNREMLKAYVRLPSLTFFSKCRSIVRHRFYYTGLTRNLLRLLAL